MSALPPYAQAAAQAIADAAPPLTEDQQRLIQQVLAPARPAAAPAA